MCQYHLWQERNIYEDHYNFYPQAPDFYVEMKWEFTSWGKWLSAHKMVIDIRIVEMCMVVKSSVEADIK